MLPKIKIQKGDNEEIVKLAFQNAEEYNLSHVSKRLREREDIIKISLKINNGLDFKYASNRLKNNEEIIRLAIRKHGVI